MHLSHISLIKERPKDKKESIDILRTRHLNEIQVFASDPDYSNWFLFYLVTTRS